MHTKTKFFTPKTHIEAGAISAQQDIHKKTTSIPHPKQRLLPIGDLINYDPVREADNTPFCPSQEKFHTVFLQGVRNISDTLKNPTMRFPPERYILPTFRLLILGLTRRANPNWRPPKV